MIVFEQPTVRISISNKTPYTHIFKGVNNGHSTVKITKVLKSCTCTSSVTPTEVYPGVPFEVSMTVDKTGQTGYFGASITLEFDNGQTEKLKVNGELKS